MNDRSWAVFHQHWPKLKPPLAPTPAVAAAVRSAIGGGCAHALLLGVTPILADIGDKTLALDWNDDMIARVWPGDTAHRRALKLDWRDMPDGLPRCDAVIGDGSFNCLDYPVDFGRVFAGLERVLAPGARFALRFFTTPSPCESLAELRRDTLEGRIIAIDALKWRLAGVVASRSGANVMRGAIHAAFEDAFPDRKVLLEATGWTENDLIAIDWYKGVKDTISFPTREEILAVVPPGFRGARFMPSGDYELAERCPVLAMEFAP